MDTHGAISPLNRSMIEAAIAAPSPDNNQPWKFEETGDELRIYLDADRSLPSDEASMFDMTALGAAAENCVIAAAKLGYQAEPVWHHPQPTENGEFLVASIRTRGSSAADPLFEQIFSRCTCRKPYQTQSVTSSDQKSLNASVKRFPPVRLDWISERNRIAAFSRIIADTDGLRFRHRPFHEELFRQLRFTEAEALRTSDGLDVKTLELPPGVATALKCLRSWSVMQWLHRMRFTRLLTAPSATTVRRSGAIALISVPNATSENFFNGGRAFQRFWLTASSLGLAVHPLGSLPIFLLQKHPNDTFRDVIARSRSQLSELLPQLDDRVLQMAVRIGKSEPPSARSRRRSIDQVTRQQAGSYARSA